MLKYLAAGFGLTCMFAPTALHATGADLATEARACAKVSNSFERLKCFDAMTAKLGVAAEAKPDTPAAAPSETWRTTEFKSAINDARTLMVMLTSTQVEGGNGGPADANLVVRCKEGKVAVFLSTAEYFGPDARPVLVRIGAQAARTEKWNVSGDGKAIGPFESPRAAALVREMEDQPSLVIKADIYHGPPWTAQFDLAGGRSALEPVLALCAPRPVAGRRRR